MSKSEQGKKKPSKTLMEKRHDKDDKKKGTTVEIIKK